MVAPSCELRLARNVHMYQTYVIKVVEAHASLHVQGQATVFDARALASATVEVHIGAFSGYYMVQMFDKECQDSAFASRTHREIQKLPGNP